MHPAWATAWDRVASHFEKQIHEAIVLACEDMVAADVLLVRLRVEALEAKDARAALACLKALSVITAVTGATDGRWVAVCRDLAKEDPDNVSSWICLGQAEEAAGRPNAAGRAYLHGLEISTDKRTDQLLREALDRVAGALTRSNP